MFLLLLVEVFVVLLFVTPYVLLNHELRTCFGPYVYLFHASLSGLSSQTAPVFTPIHRTVPLTSGRGGNFRGGGGGGIRGRSVLTRGRGAPRALAKRRGTRRFNRGAATNPQQMRANLDKELNEYMGGGKRSCSPPRWLIYLEYLNAHYDATVCPAGRKTPPPYDPDTPHYTGGYQRKSQRGGVVVLFPVELLAEHEVYART
ncbi:hypothetical protein EGR_05259 [Echinococcus granulosus]|uniref:Chromatin target of PRMT1 protein C-terminal domain-containing protein n=1 Tax=Echinococcus granulosus TaxID=6210 RepID=W6UFR6_ECHGR|nr:hypothetical protein EGR_05259 [Echinococcus granulosus]EUB59933.1 hypothetical protein EGR_05259 [Echinococcus granulosus]